VDLERIVAELEEERDRLGQAINALKQLNSSANAPKTVASNGRTSIARGGALACPPPAQQFRGRVRH
jgi:hypothetical protein